MFTIGRIMGLASGSLMALVLYAPIPKKMLLLLLVLVAEPAPELMTVRTVSQLEDISLEPFLLLFFLSEMLKYVYNYRKFMITNARKIWVLSKKGWILIVPPVCSFQFTVWVRSFDAFMGD